MTYGAFLAEYFHNHHLSNHYEKAMTVTFISIIFGQYANLPSRRIYGPALDKYLFSNGKFLGAFAFSISGKLPTVYVSILNPYFHTSALLAIDLFFPIMAEVLCLSIVEFRKIKTP